MITRSLIPSPLLKNLQDRSGLSTTFQTHIRDHSRADVIQPRPSECVHKSVGGCELADHSSKSGDLRGFQDKDDARYQTYWHLATDLALGLRAFVLLLNSHAIYRAHEEQSCLL